MPSLAAASITSRLLPPPGTPNMRRTPRLANDAARCSATVLVADVGLRPGDLPLRGPALLLDKLRLLGLVCRHLLFCQGDAALGLHGAETGVDVAQAIRLHGFRRHLHRGAGCQCPRVLVRLF